MISLKTVKETQKYSCFLLLLFVFEKGAGVKIILMYTFYIGQNVNFKQ